MKCTKCNNEIQPGSSFCRICGAPVERKENKLNIISLKCPNCDSKLEVEDGLDTFFCKYCGVEIVLEGQSDAAYRAKTRIKNMEHDERMADKKYAHENYKMEQENKKEKSQTKRGILITLACVIVFLQYWECLLRDHYRWKQNCKS